MFNGVYFCWCFTRKPCHFKGGHSRVYKREMFFLSPEKFVNWVEAIFEYSSSNALYATKLVRFLPRAKPTQLKQLLQSVHNKMMKLHTSTTYHIVWIFVNLHPMVKKTTTRLYRMQTFLKIKYLNKKKCLLNTLKKFEQVTNM